MSELGDIHEKINETKLAVTDIAATIAATFPHLATKEDLTAAVINHADKMHNIKSSNFIMVKVVGALVAALGILGGVIAVLN